MKEEEIREAVKEGWLDGFAYDSSSYKFHESELNTIESIVYSVKKLLEEQP